jgi:hypothetical protein
MKIESRIVEWKDTTSKITNQFLYDYFDDVDPDYYWVGDEVGGILNYGDYFFNFSDILTCYKLEITFEQLINWYDFCLSSQKINISLSKFILSPEERLKKEEEYLQELKERVTFAENEFYKALNSYGREEDID